MRSYPTPSAVITYATHGKLSNGKTVVLRVGDLVKVIRKENLPSDHGFGDYSEKAFVVVYSSLGLVLVSVFDVLDNQY